MPIASAIALSLSAPCCALTVLLTSPSAAVMPFKAPFTPFCAVVASYVAASSSFGALTPVAAVAVVVPALSSLPALPTPFAIIPAFSSALLNVATSAVVTNSSGEVSAVSRNSVVLGMPPSMISKAAFLDALARVSLSCASSRDFSMDARDGSSAGSLDKSCVYRSIKAM